jgi:hypothetical protein
MMDIIEQAGTALACPSQTLYIEGHRGIASVAANGEASA